ncbi:MAG TPA: EamA family transporter [Terriglobales bacterium]|nr:EamA family transporter [Terriglobales bacterium]
MSAFSALWLTIVLSACAQVFLKRGVTQNSASAASFSYVSLLKSPWVWAWMASFVLATGLWLIAMSRIEVSYAFPLLSISYPIVAVLSIFVLRERVPASRWMAIAVITFGVALIYRSA